MGLFDSVGRGIKNVGKAIGKGVHDVGKVLPSTGQFIGGLALGPLGQVVGGRIDPHTTGLQRGIGDTVGAATGAIGLGALAGLPLAGAGSAVAAGAKALPLALGHMASSAGDLGLGDLVDYGLGGANLYNAAKLGQQSTEYAKKAEDAVTGSYNERAPLRIAGIEGMLHPEAGNAAKLAGVNAVARPQIAPQPLPIPLTDPRLAMVNRTQGRGNPWAQPPLPIR